MISSQNGLLVLLTFKRTDGMKLGDDSVCLSLDDVDSGEM